MKKTPRTTASPRSISANDVIGLNHHLQIGIASLFDLLRTPWNSLMTASVIGIALALPTGLYVLLENISQLSQEWGGTTQMTLFLKPEYGDEQARLLVDQLYQRQDVHSIRLITRSEALEEYRQLSGFKEALDLLKENPLPAVLVIQPTENSPSLLGDLKNLPQAELVEHDQLWIKRLLAMTEIVQQGVILIAVLLGLTVFLVIGNTIRLMIYNRREEIRITQLLGATEHYLIRPYLYLGFWYGCSGSLIAALIIKITFSTLALPVKHLTDLYQSSYQLTTLDLNSTLLLLLSGSLLGITSAWVTTKRYLKQHN